MADPEERLKFGPFQLDTDTWELWRDGTRVPIQRQPARVLHALARSPGAVVSREALRQQIWGDATHVDFAHGLNYCIRQVRLALGDSAEHPTYVETLPRVGYRFLGPVERLPTAHRFSSAEPHVKPAESPDEISPEAPAQSSRTTTGTVLRRLRHSIVLLSARVGVVTIATAAWFASLPLRCPSGPDSGHHDAFVTPLATLWQLATIPFR